MKNYYKFKMKPIGMNVVATIMLLVMFYIVYLIKPEAFEAFISPWFLVYLLLWFFLHEILHAIGFGIIEDIKNKETNVVFGMKLEVSIMYCMRKKETSKERLLVALLLPLVLIGIITLIIGIVISSNALIMLSVANIVGAIGDIIMSAYIVKMKDIIYLDLDDPLSFIIVSKEDLSKNKYFCLEVAEKGKYNKEIKAKEYKRFVISKVSKIIMSILLIIIIVGLVFN